MMWFLVTVRARLLVSLCMIAVLFTCETCAEETHGDATSPVVALNQAFREAYAAARRELLSRSSPVILASGGQIVLLNQGQRIEGEPVERRYHDLKTIAHVPLAIYVCLAPYGERRLDDSQVSRLQNLKDLIEAVEKVLPERFDEPGQRQRHQAALDRSSGFIDEVLKHREFSKDRLASFLDDMLPQVMENVEQAVHIRIDNYSRHCLAWREMLGPRAWSRVRVVVQGAAMPRDDNLTVQFFAKLLGDRGESERIIYAESLFDEQEALNLLGTHLLDTQIGIDFFCDPWRMHRDLLGPAAARYLDQQ